MSIELNPPQPIGSIVRSWGLTQLRPNEHAHWAALRAVVSVGTPIAVVLALGHKDWTLFASFGAFNSLYARNTAYAARLRMQAEAGLFLLGAVTLGVVVAVTAGVQVAILATAFISVTSYLVSRWLLWSPPGALFAVFATGACAAHPQPWSALPIAIAVTGSAALFALLVGQSGRLFPAGRNRDKAGVRARLPMSELFGAQGVRGDLVAYAAGPLIAGSIAAAAGGAHPYWAMVSAVAPLTGPSSTHRVSRAMHRILGTSVGVLLSLAILAFHPSVVATLVIALLAQAWAELFVARNYALAVVGVTPLALLMQHLAVESNPLATATDRLIETALGLGIAIALILITRPPAGRAQESPAAGAN